MRRGGEARHGEARRCECVQLYGDLAWRTIEGECDAVVAWPHVPALSRKLCVYSHASTHMHAHSRTWAPARAAKGRKCISAEEGVAVPALSRKLCVYSHASTYSYFHWKCFFFTAEIHARGCRKHVTNNLGLKLFGAGYNRVAVLPPEDRASWRGCLYALLLLRCCALRPPAN